ncbi:NAD(P)H-dependent oxidoreductase [Mycolicibacterium setense]|uniref:NAD(P)H-dependent oxidoreductase n=1 Tax=Mycolicibacterium setense TaxID=431269 RepID=UPI00039DDB9F|nr:NAD(P)H-dependent oxidoreductase [Mycolicibacterium setense]KHO25051.1 NADPH-quinone reductase [Mycolicibacterium setense]MCV7109659.1 NAD(P)H-dependent oxidoreductase [Mycolicibacterium setense]OBB09938.1 NADPH-quinone reductase [Mycolicibacterium setense]
MTITHPPKPGTALWLYAHPRRGSLNDRLFQAGTEALSAQYEVMISDLHAQEFDPVLSDRDFGEPAGKPGNIVELAGEAYSRGQLPADVREEQAKLAAAELLVVQFPLWWYGPPAILKGWFDRVLTNGFAYGDLDPDLGVPRRYGDGGLIGRRALIVVTAGEDARSIGPRGISGDLESLLFPLIHGTLWYVGIETLDLHVIHDADGLEAADVDLEAQRLQERLRTIGTEPVRRFRRLRDGDYQETRALRGDLLPGRTDLGIHLADHG